MDKQKSSLLDALVRLGVAQSDVVLQNEKSGSEQKAESAQAQPEVAVKDVDATWAEIMKWAEMNDNKVMWHIGKSVKVLKND